jgi:uncharacterized protein YjdB
MVRVLSRAAVVRAATIALAAACADDPLSAPARPALALSAADAGASGAAASLAITPDTARVVVGRARRLAAVVRDSAGNALDGPAVAWSSSAEDVARVDSAGTVTGVAVGAATITATVGGRTASAVVAVHDASVYAVTIAQRPIVLLAGDMATLAAAARDAQDSAVADAAVRWASADTTIAAVDSASGLLTARGVGAALLTATSGARSDTVTVTVVPGVAGLRVDLALDTLEAYDVRALRAVFTDSAGRVVTHGPAVARRAVRWSSSDTAIATIDSVTGALTGVDRGTVTITARSDSLAATVKRVVVIRHRSFVTATEHACDLASGGVAWCWGNNANGQLGAPSVAASSTPVAVAGGLSFRSLSAGYGFACGVATDAAVHCWGMNKDGQLGAAVQNGATRPTRAAGSLLAAEVSAANVATGGGSYACAVTADRLATWCWGRNDKGQLGNGTTATTLGMNATPTVVVGQKPNS